MEQVDLKWAQNLVRKYAPIVYFHDDDIYELSSVEWFIERCQLLTKDGQVYQNLTFEDLKTHNHEGTRLALKSSEEKYRIGSRKDTKIYVHLQQVPKAINQKETFFDLQYWFFYPYNGAPYLGNKVGGHEGDWEQVTVRLSNIFTHPAIHKVYLSAHKGGKWLVPHSGAVPKKYVITLYRNTQPIVFSSKHSHAFYEHDAKIKHVVILKDRTEYGHRWNSKDSLTIISDGLSKKYFDLQLKKGNCVPTDLPLGYDKLFVCKPSLAWMAFKGKWGADDNSPTGPLQKGTWDYLG